MTGDKPRIAVIGTGGSISTPGRDAMDLFEYSDYGRTVEVDEVLAMFPELAANFDILPVRFRAVVSTAITEWDWLDLHRTVSEVAARNPDIAGVVITHGTSSIEETAYFLHLTLKVALPVVLVGAQRPPNGLSGDAGLNLVNAARVAASKEAHGLGVLVVMNDEVHSAREVTKTSNFRLNTFQTPEIGILGNADPDGAVAIYRRPARRHTRDAEFDVTAVRDFPRVDIVYSHVGADGYFIEAAMKRGSRGVVVAGMPPGLQPPAQRQAMVEASRCGLLVVQSSRGGAGRVLPRARDIEAGIVYADNLNPQKARVLAVLALSATEDRDEIRRMFEQY